MKRILPFILCLGLIQFGFSQIHVATDGNDSNNGSEEAPFKTIQNAIDYVENGGIIYIHEGIYFESLYFFNSGTETQDLVLRPFNEDHVVIDGSLTDSYGLIELVDVHHITLEDLEIQNHIQKDAVGILIEGRSSDISILNCKIHDIHFSDDSGALVNNETNAQPLVVYGTEGDFVVKNIAIIGNEIYNSRIGYSEALAINGNVKDFIIAENVIHDVSNIGIDIIGHEEVSPNPGLDQARSGLIVNNEIYRCLSPYATAAGIYVDGARSITIERNKVYENQWGIEIGCENQSKSASDVIVRNNVIYKNDAAGLHIGGYDYPEGSGKVEHVWVLNNTLFGNNIQQDYSGELYLSYSENLRILNNVFVSDNEESLIISSEDLQEKSKDFIFSHNNCFSSDNEDIYFYYEGKDYQGLSEFEDSQLGINTNFKFDPKFENTVSTFDWHLAASSELIDLGMYENDMPIGILDFDGHERLFGGSIDIGADEYIENISAIAEITPIDIPKLYPNPVRDVLYIGRNNHDDTSHPETLSVFNLLGHPIFIFEYIPTFIDLRHLPAGIYILKFNSEKQSERSIRIIKQ